MNILVIRLSSIGDVVHTIPSVAALAEALPAARIDWLVGTAAAPIVAELPWVSHRIVREVSAARTALRLAEVRYDLALDFHGIFRSSVFTLLSRARSRAGRGRWPWLHRSFPMFDRARAPHAIENTARVLAAAGVPPERAGLAGREFFAAWGARLTVRGAALEREHGLPATFRAAFPDARWPSKRLASAGAAGGAPLVVLGGGNKGPLAAPFDLRGRLSLLDSVALALRAEHVVAADTGPAHLAALLGARITGCFGPTRPAFTGLRGPHASNVASSCGGCLKRRCARAGACMAEALAKAASG
jgi:heptosyltransferase I